jgi:hypothetical protein
MRVVNLGPGIGVGGDSRNLFVAVRSNDVHPVKRESE